jgi:hypothetical protein
LLLALLALSFACVPSALARKPPVYRSPHYLGRHVPANFVPAKPAPPVMVSTDGTFPHLLVDGAGTAHVAWAVDPNGQPATLEYCRLPRGATGCAVTKALTVPVPTGSGWPENGDGTNNTDFQGPWPLAVGNELVLLDRRCCFDAPGPDGQKVSAPDYLFTSEDAGQTFTGPSDPFSSAGIVGTLPPSGNAVVYGGPDNPSIGIITDTDSCGTCFQGVPAGQFTRANVRLNIGTSDNYDGRLGVDGGRPIAAFDDNGGGNVHVREWTGVGDINDPSTWSTLAVPGANFSPRLVSGPSGTVLITKTGLLGSPLQARQILDHGTQVGPPVPLNSKQASFVEASEDPVSGRIAVAWLERDSDSEAQGIHVRTSADGGQTWSPDAYVTALPANVDMDELSVSATADGGGFVAFREATGLFHGSIGISQFGPIGSTGKPGLGLAGGGSGPPSGDQTAYTSCSDVHFGAIDALATQGCFLRDPRNQSSGAAVASGPIRLNGLDIVPDAGARILLDPRQHTIDTEGDVSVELTGVSDGPIVLWHGGLHVRIPDAGAGQTLFDFDTSQFAAILKGFPINGHIQVILDHDAVRIPISISLPPYLGGVSGDATLLADNAHGLHLDSLHLHADDVFVGPLEIKPIDISYTATGDIWDGSATIYLPTGDETVIHGHVRFEAGGFKEGDFSLTLYPGIPLFEDVFLNEVGFGLQLNPTVISGDLTVGIQPIAPPDTFAVSVHGAVHVQISPFKITITGDGSVLGVDVATVGLVFSADPTYVRADFSLHLGASTDDCGLFDLGFQVGATIYAGGGGFGGLVKGGLCIFSATPGVSGAVSDQGIAICASPSGDSGPGLSYRWGDSIFDIQYSLTDCYVSKFVNPPPGAVARDAQAGDEPFKVPHGDRGENLNVVGATGAPSVTLISPSGRQITPAPVTQKSAQVVAGSIPQAKRTIIAISHPAAGTWTVRPSPGSSAIASLQQAHDLGAPKARVRVTGHGRVRVLHYAVSRRPGLVIQFAEAIGSGQHVLGIAKHARGSIKFTPADGPKGKRTIFARILQDGLQHENRAVASYIAPPPLVPAAVRHLGARRTKRGVRVSFGRVPGAAKYVVRVALPLRRVLMLSTRTGHASFGAVRSTEAATVTVRGVTAHGRFGHVARVRVKAKQPKLKRPNSKHRHH